MSQGSRCEVAKTFDVDISETVCPNDLKFAVRIVLYQVSLHIKFQVIWTNRFRDINIGILPEKTIRKNEKFFGGGRHPLANYKSFSRLFMFFATNFRRRYLGNGLSKLLEI